MSPSMLQANTPRPPPGRVLSIYPLSLQRLLPFGALLAGITADGTGAREAGRGGKLIGPTMATLALIFAVNFRGLT